MSHCVDDRIQSEAIGIGGEFRRIVRIVHPFPRVAEIGIVSYEYHQPAFIVGNATDVRLRIVRLFKVAGPAARCFPQLAEADVRNLNDVIDVEKGMENRMMVAPTEIKVLTDF